MIKKVIKIQSLDEHKKNSVKDDLDYWLSKTQEERIAAVEYLRRQNHGNTARLQRSLKVIKRSQS